MLGLMQLFEKDAAFDDTQSALNVRKLHSDAVQVKTPASQKTGQDYRWPTNTRIEGWRCQPYGKNHQRA